MSSTYRWDDKGLVNGSRKINGRKKKKLKYWNSCNRKKKTENEETQLEERNIRKSLTERKDDPLLELD